MSDTKWTPGEYVVYVHINDQPAGGRIGGYRTLEAAHDAIKSNERSRKDTLGGLLPAASGNVSYSVWKAEWTKVE